LILGHLRVENFLLQTNGLVSGGIITDAKDRQYRQAYTFTQENDDLIIVSRSDGNGDEVTISKSVELDESLLAFFGLYSGDGAKGSEKSGEPGRIFPLISFSQKEKHLIRFAVDQFKKLFPGNIRFVFSLGEDSAFFMEGEGKDLLESYYHSINGVGIPENLPLSAVRHSLDEKDKQYLSEIRPDVSASNEECLAFYYQHKSAMKAILTAEKERELASVGIDAASNIRATASLRRPFKKGARTPGGSSRSDEIHLGGLNGIGELFLKMMHEIEDSILQDRRLSSTGLVEWLDQPSSLGQNLDLFDFFTNNEYGKINNEHPIELEINGEEIVGKWRRSKETNIRRNLRIDPLWCYISGLYLAEGTTPKEKFFKMFSTKPGSLALGFTSSEGPSLELMLRTLQKLFRRNDCLEGWKVKVGSQYFSELVVSGLKQGMPMLRGGASGDGKLRTMEISLEIKNWALEIADISLNGKISILRNEYSDRYSHVEPTGAGVARIDFWASSTLCRWYFPLVMYTVFGGIILNPSTDFYE
jgi:hypothetical protein